MWFCIGFIYLALLGGSALAIAGSISDEKPRLAIIIDDLGDRLKDGRRVITLNANITVGIIPYRPYSRTLAQLANKKNKEIMLHLPMESLDQRYLGKAGLRVDMTEAELNASLDESLASLKNIRGINNHMGSRLTQNTKIMRWLMKKLQVYGNLYFVDSRTIDTSQAIFIARQVGIEHATRDVFLDNDKNHDAMAKQWRYFLKHANKEGSAVMIAHPYPETISFLQQRLIDLSENYKLISVSSLIRWRHNRSKLAWQQSESSSH